MRARSLLIFLSAFVAVGAQAPTPAPPDPAAAAQALLQDLYSGLLRRPEPGEAARGQVKRVVRQGTVGLVLVASELAASEEFRRQAVPRTVEAHDELRKARARPTLETIANQLLLDVYRDLLGRSGLRTEEHQRLRANLFTCLEEGVRAESGCRRFAAELVRHPFYQERHHALLEALSQPERNPSP